MAGFQLVDVPSEVQVGTALGFQVRVPRSHKNTWVGFYVSSVPSIPGVSCGRWAYIPNTTPNSSSSSSNSDGGDGGGGSQVASSSSDCETVSVSFTPEKLPNHAGVFEVRLHSGKYNNYKVRACQRVVFTRQPVSRTKRALFLSLLVLVVAFFQHLLNAKGECTTFQHIDSSSSSLSSSSSFSLSSLSSSSPDIIKDHLLEATAPLNAYLSSHPAVAELVQASSSLVLDVTLLLLLFLAAMSRSTIRPFLALFVLMSLRFVAQSIATFPCPPGFIWPRGAVLGVPVPTLFVDYHPANDFFFSGHVGTIIVAAIEFAAMDYWKTSLFQLAVVTPLISLVVLAFRVHRGTDVFAAVIASIAACAISERFVEVIDLLLIQTETPSNARQCQTPTPKEIKK